MRRRALAWALVLYGAAGLVLAVTGAAIGLDVATRVERLADDADGTLAAAARATRTAADSFENVDASLSDAQESAIAAAALSGDASGTLRSLGLAMELSLLGSQPLLPLAEEFATSADQADALADTLASVGGSLGDTRTDLTVVATELGSLADRLERLRGAGGDEAAPPPLRLFVMLLLVWMMLPAIAALVAGLALLRRPREVVMVEQLPPDDGARPSRPA
jgi:hypothetical protein